MRTGPAVPGSHSETAASVFKCLPFTDDDHQNRPPICLHARRTSLDSAKTRFGYTITACPRSVCLGKKKKHVVSNVGNDVWMPLSNWVVLLCNAVFVCEPVYCTDTVCIVLYRPMIHLTWPTCLFKEKGSKVHCAVRVQIFENDYAKCA